MSRVVPQDIVSRIKDETDIVAVVREYVSLKPAGSAFKGLCPFHREKTPSFQVNPARQIFKCFGCGEGGDVITFLMKLQGLSFPEALEILARSLNIDLARYLTEDEEGEGERQSFYRAQDEAATLWREALWEPEGRAGLEYLHERGFPDDLLRRYDVGFAPPGTVWLESGLKRLGIAPELALRAGLMSRGERDAPFAYFRNRVIFPIKNVAQRVVGFGGRIVGQGEPKYLNSPESAYFNKRKLLYGFSSSRIPIARVKAAVLVEGYLDLLALAKAGFNNVVATCGTAFTPEQAALLRRGCRSLYVLYDGDRAGRKAAVQAAGLALTVGLEPRVVLLPDGEDPDSFLGDHTAEEMGELLRAAPGYLRVLDDFAAPHGREAKERAVATAMNTLAGVEDAIRRSLLLDEAAEVFGLPREVLENRVETLRSSPRRRPTAEGEGPAAQPAAAAAPGGRPRGRDAGAVDVARIETVLLAHVLEDAGGRAAALMLELWADRTMATAEGERLRGELVHWQDARAAGREVSPAAFVQERWYDMGDGYQRFVTDLLAERTEPAEGDYCRVVQDCHARLAAADRPDVEALRAWRRKEDDPED